MIWPYLFSGSITVAANVFTGSCFLFLPSTPMWGPDGEQRERGFESGRSRRGTNTRSGRLPKGFQDALTQGGRPLGM